MGARAPLSRCGHSQWLSVITTFINYTHNLLAILTPCAFFDAKMTRSHQQTLMSFFSFRSIHRFLYEIGTDIRCQASTLYTWCHCILTVFWKKHNIPGCDNIEVFAITLKLFGTKPLLFYTSWRNYETKVRFLDGCSWIGSCGGG